MAELPPESKVCLHQLAGGPAFKIVVGLDRSDPVAEAFLGGAPSPSEPLLRLMLALVRPGATVLDLGAHVGTFALTACAAGCRVLAVEGSPRNAALLRASAAVNDFGDRLRVVHAVAGNRDGVVDFSPYGAWGHVASDRTGLPSLPVRAVRVESLLTEAGMGKVDFIKMDVEGSEIAALEGMGPLLQHEDAPPILYESNYYALHFYDQTPRKLRATLCEAGYAFHHLIHPSRLTPAGRDYFQAEVSGEYLATKRPPVIRGWRLTAPLTPNELARILAGECLAAALPTYRALLAQALSEAPPELLAYPPLCELLQWLWSSETATTFPQAVLRRLLTPAQRMRQGVGRWLGRLRRLLTSPPLDRAG